MAIDRSKYKQTSVSQLTQSDKELNTTLGKKEKLGNGHTIDEGINLFRFYPAHSHEDGGGKNFVESFIQTFLPAMVQEKDKDGKVIMQGGKPKMKLSVKPVWNTKVHGGMKKDLVEEYVNIALVLAKKMNDDERKEYLKPIYGNFISKGNPNNINGINYPTGYVVYADKYPGGNPAATPVFDELRLKTSVKKRLNAIAAVESANDPLGTDPYTNLEDGRAVKILYNKEEQNPNNIYTTEIDNSTISEVIGSRTVKVQKTYPLSDAQMEYFEKQEPLAKKYGKKLATRKNFEAQLAGLELLDNKYKIGIFGMDEWNDIVLEIDGYYPENDADPANTPTASVDEAPEETDDNSDEFDLMDRNELKAFAKENKTGILLKPSMSDDDVRSALRLWQTNSALPADSLPGENGFDENKVVTQSASKVVEPVKETAEDRKAFLNDLNNVSDTGISGITKRLIKENQEVEIKEREKEILEKPVQSTKEKLLAMRAKMTKA